MNWLAFFLVPLSILIIFGVVALGYFTVMFIDQHPRHRWIVWLFLILGISTFVGLTA